MKSNPIRIAVILGSVSIIGILAFQWYWVNRSYDLAEKQFNKSIEIALYNVAEKMAAFNQHTLPNESPVRQISSNYFIVDINDIIDARILDHYLKTEFEFRNLHIDYEYAIYDCETDKMVFGKSIIAGHDDNAEAGKFPKYDEFTYYFGIDFPTKALYIINSIDVWIISTFVLITAILFFAYAIFIILRQKRLSEIQKNFVNNMTHEIKTPLSTIGISAEVLLNPNIIENPDRLAKYASLILQQNKRLEKQIEKVLQLAQMEKKKYKLNKTNVDVHILFQELYDGMQALLDDVEGSLRLETKAEKHTIFADRVHLANVLHNLVDNAIKYSIGKPDIFIRTENWENHLYIYVTDHGMGIEKKYLSKIFQKFYRVPTGNIHDIKGFGIGLNYVKTVIKKHGWRIKVESIPNEGSTFKLIIPIKHDNI